MKKPWPTRAVAPLGEKMRGNSRYIPLFGLIKGSPPPPPPPPPQQQQLLQQHQQQQHQQQQQQHQQQQREYNIYI